MQAATIVVKNEMMTEAHLHALVNLKKENVVIISDKPVNKFTKRLACILYQPGWEPQQEVTAKKLRSLWESPNAPTSFSSLTPTMKHTCQTESPNHPRMKCHYLLHLGVRNVRTASTEERSIYLED